MAGALGRRQARENLTSSEGIGTVGAIKSSPVAGGDGGFKRLPVTKSDLIKRLAEANLHLYLRDIERIVSTVFDEVAEALVRGDRVELRGFGAFGAPAQLAGRSQSAHRRRGQCTEKVVPYFKPARICASV